MDSFADIQIPVRRHIAALDGLRAFAVLAVIAHHINGCFPYGDMPPGRVGAFLAWISSSGWVGVDLFFVLSGFLITGILRRSKVENGYFRNFYARRTLRIVPLYFGYLLLVIGILPLVHNSFCRSLKVPFNELISLVCYYYNFLQGQAFGSPLNNNLHVGPFWTLAVEEQFYLAWPIVILLLSRGGAMRACLVLGGTSALCRVFWIFRGAALAPAYFITPCRLEGLLAGAIIALASENASNWAKVQRYSKGALVGSAFLFLGIGIGLRDFQPFRDPRIDDRVLLDASSMLTLGISALAVCFASLVALILESPEKGILRRVLEKRALRSVGKYSYAMYVFHGLVIISTMHFLEWHAPKLANLRGVIGKPLLILWTSSVSYGVAWLSYHLYEKHFLRLKKHFEFALRENPKRVAPDLAAIVGSNA